MTTTDTNTLELARQLIRRPSITPDDAGCQQLLTQRLGALGFHLEPMRFGEVQNLWARFGDNAPLLVFAGHTDVVPTGDLAAWQHPPFAAAINNGLLYGRGAADMKGSIAAMITATERFLAATQPTGSIGFLITSDEEGPAVDGTQRVIEMLEARREKIDYCIIGEPTSDRQLGDVIKNGRRGSLSGHLIVHGTQGHVAYPHLADNPVHRALAALTELVSIQWDAGTEHFPATSLQISNVQAGTGAANVIPGQFSIDFNLRFSPELTVNEIQRRVSELLKRHRLHFLLDWSLSGHPFITESGRLTQATVQAIRARCGIETRLDTGGGTSDGRFIAPTGAQVIELGPINATIHKIDEYVSTQDLIQLSCVYEDILQRLLQPS